MLHCVSSYPVDDSDANLQSITYLKNNFNVTVGYSNHVNGINACLGAIALGARVVEFHFTDNKKRKFRDHKLSLNTSDVRDLIKKGNNLKLMLGKYEKKFVRKLLKIKKHYLKALLQKMIWNEDPFYQKRVLVSLDQQNFYMQIKLKKLLVKN